MKQIEIRKGIYALVDDCDAELVSGYKWTVHGGYACTTRSKKTGRKAIRMHRLILGLTDPSIIVDHINRDKLDNRRCNLRTCTELENAWNKGKRMMGKHGALKSRFIGVGWLNKNKKWIVNIINNGKHKGLGTYNSEETAAFVYNNYAKKYRGEFAVLNEIDESKVDFEEIRRVADGIKSSSKSGVRGVYFDNKSKRWRVVFKSTRLGSYKSLEEAKKVYEEASAKYPAGGSKRKYTRTYDFNELMGIESDTR